MDLKSPPPPPGNGCAEIIAIGQSGHHWNEFYLTHKGTRVYVDVSPCSWMNKGYGTQVKLSLKPSRKVVNAQCVFHCDKTKPCDSIPREKILEQGKQVAREWLAENGVKPIERTAAKWAKQEPILRARVDKEMAKERERQAKEDARMVKKGHTFRFDAWIHPEDGGDDYRIVAYYSKQPLQAEIDQMLSKSAVKTDFKVTNLLAPPPYPQGSKKAREEAEEDARMKADGYTHRIRALIFPHPEPRRRPKPYIKRAYSKEPFTEDYLRRVFFSGCAACDQYDITTL